MKKIFRSLRWLIITLAVIIAVLALATLTKGHKEYKSNSDAITKQRVFDYADKLTDDEENKLEALIDKRQKQTGYDIVLVTLDCDVSDVNAVTREGIFKRDYYDVLVDNYDTYTSDFNSYAYDEDYDKFNLYVFQRAFWDEYRFGFDGHPAGATDVGAGTIFVDNWYDEKTWFGTAGDYSLIEYYEKDEASASWHLLDLVGDQVVISPYLAYTTYVNTIYFDKVGGLNFNTYISIEWPLVAALVLALIFLIGKSLSAKPKDTTTSHTYVRGNPVINQRTDMFIRKYTTHRTISSGSGGSGGGGGHGGGGHGGHGGGH